MTVGPPLGLHTDHYELTMLEAALQSGAAERPCVFEVFTRRLPAGRRYGVLAGTGRLLDALADFRFDDDAIAMLSRERVVDRSTCDWLAAYRFRGSIEGYAEGEPYFPGSPVLSVHGTFAEAVLLETLVLSMLNHDSAIAAAAARMVHAADGRPLIEMGSRRTHEEAAVASARAAYLVGFDTTSNLAARERYGVPTTGTSAHAFTLVHDDETAAFRAQLAALGKDTTLLVDTYDVEAAVRRGVELAGPSLGAVRLDSGDLAETARSVRRLLDELGATQTRVVATSDLDEHTIAELRKEPVDGFGVGTSVATGSGAPTAGFVYKLVARARHPGGELEPVAKSSAGKSGHGGAKTASRRIVDGVATAEVVHVGGAQPNAGDRQLTTPLVKDGDVLPRPELAQLRAHHQRAMAELPPVAHDLDDGEPALPTVYEESS
jgi:nicotinate phosphoribosyltransferase